jgi:glyoxylase-like metal-dependent hydrolase (beta-lactamase superfamily II)
MPDNTLAVGNVSITSLSDGLLEFDLCNFFPSIPEEQWLPYRDHLSPEGKVSFNLAAFLIRSDGKNILVDTGLGPKPADAPETPWGELMNDFQAHGIRPEEIDAVVMTHLHRDHVGWNTVRDDGGNLKPTFPNARYYFSKVDLDASHDPALQPDRYPNAPDCVWPLVDMGLVELMEGEFSITGELTTVPTPGHTPGHMSIMIDSGGERALILGDVLHNTAQIQQTGWASRADIIPEQAIATRQSVLDRLENEGIPVAAVHLPAPGFGKIVRLQGRRYWQAI